MADIPKIPKQLLGLLGNLPEVGATSLNPSFQRLAKLYGPIYELDLVKEKRIVISSYELAKEVLDDDHYEKTVEGALKQARPLLKDALVTAKPSEKNWGIAHRILMPILGPMAVRNMFDDQLDISSQMILQWDRLGPNNEIACLEQFTRLTLDSIALCGFSHRFNHFDTQEMHPFSTHLMQILVESDKRSVQTQVQTSLRFFAESDFQRHTEALLDICDQIMKERIQNPNTGKKDLLDAMLTAEDPESGEKLSLENIRSQVVTFLAAAHIAPSNALSMFFHTILTHPETYHRIQQEVDEVLGQELITADTLSKLTYLKMCLAEVLRLHTPGGQVDRRAKEKCVLAGKYQLDPSMLLTVNIIGMHRDPAVWGDDCNNFKPERLSDMDKYPSGSWKPWGVGMRSCTGRPFAEQLMFMTIALILQRFQVDLVSPLAPSTGAGQPGPGEVRIKVRSRKGRSKLVGLGLGTSQEELPKQNEQVKDGKPMTILYGSNAGTCRTYAEDLASNAARYGFSATIRTLDSAVEDFPKNQPVAIITASYEGKPTDDARKFVSWLGTKPSMQDVQYLLFGVGNSEWSTSFHKVPKDIQRSMEEMGASPLVSPGFVDVKYDMVGSWEEWTEQVWSVLGQGKVVQDDTLEANIGRPESSDLLAGFETSTAVVRENIALAGNDVGPTKMHMEVELKDGVNYQSGDYLAIVPANHAETMQRVLCRFDLNAADTISIPKTRKNYLKTSHPISIYEFLATRVDLNMPITQRQLEKLIQVTKESAEIDSLKKMVTNVQEVLSQRFSVLDVLEDHPSCALDFISFVDLLKPITPRQYSISSSAVHPDNVAASRFSATITYDVLEQPALSGGDRKYYGVASNYLRNAAVGTRINCTVRPTNAGFHLPSDPTTPIILIATSTGIAPMRGFLQERAAIAKNKEVGPALLYFGCRDHEKDYIYKQELEEWEKQGVVSLRPCFSQRGPPDCHRYTADRMYAEKHEIGELYEKNAKIFVCGSANKVAKSTVETLIKMWLEGNPDKQEADAREWLDSIKEDRYVSDVFG